MVASEHDFLLFLLFFLLIFLEENYDLYDQVVDLHRFPTTKLWPNCYRLLSSSSVESINLLLRFIPIITEYSPTVLIPVWYLKVLE